MISLMIYVISHGFSLLLDMFHRLENIYVSYSVQAIQLLFPPLEALNTKDVIGTSQTFGNMYFLYNTVYGVLYLSLILFFTTLIFNKKKFED